MRHSRELAPSIRLFDVGERLRFLSDCCQPAILPDLPTSPVPVHRPLMCGFANAPVQVAGMRSEW